MELTERDRLLLDYLQDNAQITNAELAEKVDLSTSGVQKRLKKLAEQGVIKNYVTVLDRKAVGYDMLCFVEVILRVHDSEQVRLFDEKVRAQPEIQECHRLTGNSDYLLKVVVRDREHLDHFLMQVLLPFPAVDRVHTRIVLHEIKETSKVATVLP
jgi:DNA-binding Lrp family transcriptional regulator